MTETTTKKTKQKKFKFVEELDQERKLLVKIGRAVQGADHSIAIKALKRVTDELWKSVPLTMMACMPTGSGGLPQAPVEP